MLLNRCRSFCLAVLGLFVAQISFSQISSTRFRHISTEQGLSNTTIQCILQDSRGFMWFGTRDGLNRYDGTRIVKFRIIPNDSNSISDNFIRCIFEDSARQLWIGTSDGLNRFDPESGRFTRYKSSGKAGSISEDTVTGITEDREGNLWIGTLNKGINRLDRERTRFTHLPLFTGKSPAKTVSSINVVYRDRNGRVWIGSQAGLGFLQASGKYVPAIQAGEGSGVTDIRQDTKGRLWVATQSEGLFLCDARTGSMIKTFRSTANHGSLSGNLVISLLCDSKGRTWAGTINTGLNLYDEKKNAFYRYYPVVGNESSLSNNTVSALYEDRQGNTWIGTHRGGINLYTGETEKFKLYRQSPGGLSYYDVKAFYEDRAGYIWIGTDGGGLNRFDRTTRSFRHYRFDPTDAGSISSDAIQAIAEDATGNLWVGTWGGGLNKLDPQRNRFTRFRHDPKNPAGLASDYLQRLLPDSHGNFWVATYFGGLQRLDTRTGRFSPPIEDKMNRTVFSGKNVVMAGEDADGNLWFGTDDGGLNRFDYSSKRYTHYFNRNTDSRVFFCDHTGKIWIGMKGLYTYDKEWSDFKPFTETGVLATAYIKGIAEDSSHKLWVSTSNGLVRLDPTTGESLVFNPGDGLQGLEFEANAYYETRDGELYFGGINGFNAFYPEQVKLNPFIPPVYLTDFQVFNKSVAPGDGSPLTSDISFAKTIELDHTQSSVSFTFAALNYIVPWNNRYEYKLERLDKEWITAGAEQKAIYTNLQPGTYTFRVRASNNDGVWNRTGASVTLIITPPFWATWWFRTLLVLLIIAGIYLYNHFRLRTISRRNELLERQVRQRTLEVVQKADELQMLNTELVQQRKQEQSAREEAEKANRAKSIFLATMSHEIRTPMDGVIGMASLLGETTLSPEQQEYTDTIISCGESLMSVINDILDFSKIESGKMELELEDFDVLHTVEEVMDIFSQRVSKQGIDLIYQLEQGVPEMLIGDSLRLKQVLINLVSNAVKFTSSGEIFIRVYVIAQHPGNSYEIGFDVRDTGIGIPGDKIGNLFRAFTQVDSSTTRKYGGTGLGLAICERLVNLMGGQITASSNYGEGSMFRFSIIAPKSSKPAISPVRFDFSGLEGTRILIVDDNATNVKILKTQLEHWQFKPVSAKSGSEALEILSTDRDFKLVITDMEMPEMDGVTLTRKIKENLPAMPVVMLSSIGDETRKKFPGLFASVLVKPVKQIHLCHGILEALNLNRPEKPDDRGSGLLTVAFAGDNPLRILIAEDNLVNQKLIDRVLLKLGYTPDIVFNGREALEKCIEKEYDVILMDIQMPEIDGLEATQRLRNMPIPQPYIVAMTANAMSEDKEICMRAGMDDYLAKPMKLEDLIQVLRNATLNPR